MIDIQYRLRELTCYLGVKKMKQLGLSPCTTCNEILDKASQYGSAQELTDELHLTPREQFEQLNATYRFDSRPTDSANTSDMNIADDTVEDLLVETNNTALEPLDLNDELSTTNDLAKEELQPTSNANVNSIPYPTSKTEDQLIASFVSALRQLNFTRDVTHDIGYLYNEAVPLPEHSIMCPECGKLYDFNPDAKQLKALPVYLSDVEYEMVKGVYVDIVL